MAKDFATEARKAMIRFMAATRGKLRYEVGRNLTGGVLQTRRREQGLLGAVWRSIALSVSGDIARVEITTGTFYGTIWEKIGRKPVTIVPTRGQALKFPIRTGEIVYSKRAQIPGALPRPFIQPALSTLGDWMEEKHPEYFVQAFPDFVVRVKSK